MHQAGGKPLRLGVVEVMTRLGYVPATHTSSTMCVICSAGISGGALPVTSDLGLNVQDPGLTSTWHFCCSWAFRHLQMRWRSQAFQRRASRRRIVRFCV